VLNWCVDVVSRECYLSPNLLLAIVNVLRSGVSRSTGLVSTLTNIKHVLKMCYHILYQEPVFGAATVD
jgi:hypothetical protein